eukprot:Nk52_evm18s2367 gene=Nk52_evmTU18s2367
MRGLRSFLAFLNVLTAFVLCIQESQPFFFVSCVKHDHIPPLSSSSASSSASLPPEDPIPVYSESATPRVAVIGAGIGGGSFSYFVRRALPNANITVFESRGRAGGRLNSFDLPSGDTVEIGGDALAAVNSYGYRLGLDLRLPVRESGRDDSGDPDGISVVFDGNAASELKSPSLWDKLAMGGCMKMFQWALKYNYWRRGTKSFNSIEEFLSYGGLSHFTSSQIGSVVKKLFSEYFIDNLIVPVLRAIYDQELEMSSFAGLTSLTPMATPAVYIENGNKRLAEESLNQSRATVRLSTAVNHVEWNKEKSVYQISSKTKDEGQETAQVEEFDHVVLAAPIEFSGLLHDVNQFSNEEIQPRSYHHWHVTFIQARDINRDALNFPQQGDGKKSIISVSTKSGVKEFHMMGAVVTKLGTDKKDYLYKIFSEERISDAFVKKYFERADIKGVSRYFWPYTFPTQTPHTRFQPHIVHQHSDDNDHHHNSFVYINGLETAATAMETSVIGARNAALVIGEMYRR